MMVRKDWKKLCVNVAFYYAAASIIYGNNRNSSLTTLIKYEI